MYYWRIPALMFAPLATGALLLVISVAFLEWRRTLKASVIRSVLLSLVVIAHFASPAMVSAIIDSTIARDPFMRKYIDPSFALLWSAAFAIPCVLLVAHRFFPRAGMASRSYLTYRAAFFALVLTFAVLNVANWCSPGWCERFGFPLPYSWWSDSIVIINDKNLTAGFSTVALLVNLTALVFIVVVMSRTYRRQGEVP